MSWSQEKMGEDVWSLVSRQLFSATSNTVKTDDGEARTPGEGGDPADDTGREGAVAAVCAFASFALCVGMPGAGKSTLLNAYLNPNNDSVPKPTVALEYMFARRASAANTPKVRGAA